MIIREHAIGPFQNIAVDIFKFNGQQILLVADQYSKMLFIKKTTLQAQTVLNTLKQFFLFIAYQYV